MTIDWNNFTPWSSLLGGALIGAAAGMFILLNGRIAGISGVLGGLLRPASLAPGDAGWRVAFVLGIVLGGVWAGRFFDVNIAANQVSLLWLAIAGGLVGFGTVMGSGCTSGHGVCGLARGSMRSLVAVVVFIGSGILTVTAMGVFK